jgi:prolyl-tRNA synthetase
MTELRALGVSVKYDDADTKKPGWKFAEYEMKGIPTRIALGERDLGNGTVEIARRDTKEKTVVPLDKAAAHVHELMDVIQKNLFDKAKKFMDDNTHQADSYEQFKDILENKTGFVYAHWDGTEETEQKIKEETKATIRNIPLNNPQEEGKCIYSGKPSKERVLFAKAY